jgi:structural maintenance of chromosomes protein 6
MKLRSEIGCVRECNAYQSDPKAVHQRYSVPLPPVDGVETVASCLTIENTLVFNTLVDQAKIDQNAIGASKEETEQLLLVRDGNGREAIKGGNIREVYFLPRGDVWKINAQGTRNMRSNERQMRQTIGADTTSAIEEAKLELSQLEIELRENKKILSQHSDSLLMAKRKWNEVKKGQRQARDAISELESKIAQLQTEIDASSNVEEIDTTDLEEDISNAEQDIIILNEKLEAIEKEKEDLESKVDEAKKKVEEVESRNERVLKDLTDAEKDLTLFMAKSGEREAQKQKAKSKVEKTREKLQEFLKVLEEKRSDTKKGLRQARLLQYRHDFAMQMRAQASEMGMSATPDLTPEDPTDEDLESVEILDPPKEAPYYAAKIDRLKKKIREERERRRISNITPEEVYEKYSRAKLDLQSKNSQLEAITENLEKLEADLKSRRKRWKVFRKHIVEMSAHTFDEILQLKGSSGGLEFDHKSKTLNLVVQKDNSNENSQTRDVKALSGGERSFVTLSLLLALGERLETPFRVMDEFDVFLDAISRKIALMTLVEIAKKMEHRQFILITPQDLSNITPDDKVKIFKLNAPARNVTVDNLTQQTLD